MLLQLLLQLLLGLLLPLEEDFIEPLPIALESTATHTTDHLAPDPFACLLNSRSLLFESLSQAEGCRIPSTSRIVGAISALALTLEASEGPFETMIIVIIQSNEANRLVFGYGNSGLLLFLLFR